MKWLCILAFLTYVFSQNLVSWGRNDNGELGVGTRVPLNTQTLTAVRVDNLTTALDSNGKLISTVALLIAAGRDHTVIYAADGNLYAWGKNNNGQLGNGNTNQQLSPVRVFYNTTTIPVQLLAAGLLDYNIMVTKDPTTGLQKVFSWGFNLGGLLGTGTFGNGRPQTIPIEVKSNNFQGEVITQLACGDYHTVLLTATGKVYSWGDNQFGQLGESTTQSKAEPTAVVLSALGTKTVTAISTRGLHNLLLANDGTVYAWGYNAQGQVGDGTLTNKLAPVLVSGLLNGKIATSVHAGYDHSIVWTSEGKAYGFGTNNFGQCGNRSTLSPIANGPVESIAINQFMTAKGETPLKTVLGDDFTLILTNTRKIVGFGRNDLGQLGDGSQNTIALGGYARDDDLTALSGRYVQDLAVGDRHVIVSSCTTIVLSIFAIIFFYL